MVLDPTRTLISDTECYPNFWSIGFRRVSDGKTLVMEHSHRRQLNVERLRNIMLQNTIVGYNWQSYDQWMVLKAIEGADNAELKRTNDRIIMGGMKWWQAEEVLGLRSPRAFDFIDLFEPQPNAFASLKTLMGRLHAPRMQDLPYHPDTELTEEQMDIVLSYMGNDLHGTHLLFDSLRDALELRFALGQEYGLDFRSKSDSQIGEAIIKKRVEQATGQRPQRVPTPAGTTFKYEIPAFLHFDRPDLQGILDRLRMTDFVVKSDGKVDLPKWLSGKTVTIGETTYAMGIGGLHSTEESRTVYSDGEARLQDFDVTSYYPSIILGSGLYPKALGPAFLDVYRKIRDDRVAAKRAGNKIADQGLKISLNGVFGKLGSPYSVLYAPHLMIAVTLTGQLSLLMLIERAEAAGIPVVSGNTDGVVFRCPRDKQDVLERVTKQWEADTGFGLESTPYEALYNQSVNTYIAVKPDGKVKRKGTLSNPYKEDMRTQLMKNPNMGVCSDAVVEFLTKGTSIDRYIRSCTDIRDFVTVVNVKGGGTWRGQYLGKVVRYIWSTDGAEILYKDPHPTTGNFKKVPKTDGCRPVMDLPESLPADIDYDRYIAEAEDILVNIGYRPRVEPVKAVKVRKADALEWLRWSLAA